MYSMIKILMSALIIAGVTEMAKRFPTYGGIVAALPIVSLLSIVWLSVQGEKRKWLVSLHSAFFMDCQALFYYLLSFIFV